jgi:Fic family protein
VNRNDLSADLHDRLERLPPPHEAHYGVVPFPPPQTVEVGALTEKLAWAYAAIDRADRLIRDERTRGLFGQLLMRQEAVSSSAIENTVSTLEDVLEYEQTLQAEPGSTAPLVRAYANVFDALAQAVAENGPAAITMPLIRHAHAILMQEDSEYRHVPGDLRAGVVHIGGTLRIATSTYNPPPPIRVRECLDQTLSYVRDEEVRRTLPLPVRMAVAHAHFEAVHPFPDGNGRVGRLLLSLMLAAEHHQPLFLAGYLEKHRDAYYAALQESSLRNDYLPIVELVLDATVAATDEAEATYEALLSLRERWLRRRWRERSAPLRTLEWLPFYPVVTSETLRSRLDISQPAAWHALKNLEEAGILTRHKTGPKKLGVYAAPEVLRIVNRPFGERPE